MSCCSSCASGRSCDAVPDDLVIEATNHGPRFRERTVDGFDRAAAIARIREYYPELDMHRSDAYLSAWLEMIDTGKVR